MSTQQELIIAGFGGQGVLSAGRILAYAAMKDRKKVTWMPSYGVEMRGGTASCTVIIAEEEIGSPIETEPYSAIVMNIASFQKFQSWVRKEGLLVINSSLIKEKVNRTEFQALYIPCNDLAEKLGNARAANMVALGAFWAVAKPVSKESLSLALKAQFPKRPELVELNMRALEAGAQAAK